MKTEKNLVPQSLSALVPSREKATFTLAEGATHVAPSKVCRKGAFTLAEVLITLAVVGVVAALTMPGIINHFRVKDLEARFKKVLTRLEQALSMASIELGIDNYKQYNIYNYETETADAAQLLMIHEVLDRYFVGAGAKRLNHSQIGLNSALYRITDLFGNVTGEQVRFAITSGSSFNNGTPFCYLFPDGSTISPIGEHTFWTLSGSALVFKIDTNGPFKGPNRVGHDYFYYYTTPKTSHGILRIAGCDPLYGNSYSTRACFENAFADIHPYDKSKTYWETLFKSRDYWNSFAKE